VIPAFNAFKIPDNISDDLASIFDPFGNAVHTALSFDLVGKMCWSPAPARSA
jgi:threonine 3-dehydrogenase